MIEKCNKIYTIFNSDVVMSDNRRINAIQGYDIEDKGMVGGYEDVNAWFIGKNGTFSSIKANKIYVFTNPVSGEYWYVGNHILAYYKKSNIHLYKDYPRIIAFVCRNDVIVTSLDTIQNYKPLFSNFGVRRITVTYDIGYLSTPHRAVVNSSIAFDTIRLPYIV